MYMMNPSRFFPLLGLNIMFLFTPTVGYSMDTTPKGLEGTTWAAQLINFDDPRWRIEDVLCGFCTREAFEYLQELLDDPANDDRSLKEIKQVAWTHNFANFKGHLTERAREIGAKFDHIDDPMNKCKPAGLITQILQTLPWTIERTDDSVVFRYEYWNAVRTIDLKKKSHPADIKTSRFGHSIGWFDGPTLVVETRGFEPHLYASLLAGGLTTTENAVLIERYTLSKDGERLDNFLTVVDPVMLREPLTMKFSWLRIPGIEFDKFECSANSGEFEAEMDN